MGKDINEILKRDEYRWVHEEPRLTDKIALLTFGGSIAYGLDTPESDIDIRGIVMPSVEDLLGAGYLTDPTERTNPRLVFGRTGFEQVKDVPTDTTIYCLNKVISLFYKCNPNTIEMLGCKPEHYTKVSRYGQMLLDNKEIFLSKLAYGSFAGYASDQFRKLKNAMGKDSGSHVFQAINLADSINRMQSHLEREYPEYRRDMIKLYVTDSDGNPITVNGIPVDAYDVGVLFNDVITEITANGKPIEDNDVELRYSINFDKVSNGTFAGIFNEVVSAVKDFMKHLGHRNHKKDAYHLNKHAMHLIRLYLMALDILEKGEINTYRENDRDLLMSIKTGAYYNKESNTFSTKFFDMVNDFDKRILNAYENSKLPEVPDRVKVNNLVMDIQREYLKYSGQFGYPYPGQTPLLTSTTWYTNDSSGEWYGD